MWPFIKKNAATHLGDRVWINNRQKHTHLLADARQYLNEGKWVIISYFFTDTGSYLSTFLEENQARFNEIDNVRPVLEDKINLVPANYFLEQYFRERLSLGTKETVILFSEHYPLFKTEQTLLKSMESFGNNVSYTFYNSFEDPLLTRFGAAKTVDLIRSLGIKEDEMISSPMITNAIGRIQKKIGSKVKFEIRTFSVENWFEENLRTNGQ